MGGTPLIALIALIAQFFAAKIRSVPRMQLEVGGWEDQVPPGMAPLLLLHGANDPVVPVAEAYKAERTCKERGVVCELEVFPGERHWMTGAAQARLLARCAEFLAERL